MCATVEEESWGSIESFFSSVCVSSFCLSAWRTVNACPGNSIGVKEKSWGAGSELLADVSCWAGCCHVFLRRSRHRDREWGGRGARRAQQGGREPFSQNEGLFLFLKLAIQTHECTVSPLFLPLIALWEYISWGCDTVGFQSCAVNR